MLYGYLPGSRTLIAFAANSTVGDADQLGSLPASVYRTLESNGALPPGE